MKKYVFILTIILFGVSIINANADSCSNEEKARLKKEAAKVKMVYEEAEGVESFEVDPHTGKKIPITYNYFKIILSNITDELVVMVKNNTNDDSIKIDYNLTENGLYSFDWNNIDEIVNFSYEVFGNTTACSGEKLADGYLVTPKYNVLHETALCDGITDFAACDKYINENTSQEVLQERINEYRKNNKKDGEKDESKFEYLISILKEHKILVGGVILIVIGSGVALVINRRRKRAI